MTNAHSKKMASASEKDINDLYAQRSDLFLLLMAFAAEIGYPVGVRVEDPKWPVHVVVLPGYGEIAIHMSADETEPVVMRHTPDYVPEWDKSTDDDKHNRIREYVRAVFHSIEHEKMCKCACTACLNCTVQPSSDEHSAH